MVTGSQVTSTQQQASTPTQPHHGNTNSSSISFSNSTVSNGTGVTISNLGTYYTATGTSISNAVWNVYTNYMKPKTFKLR